MPCMEIALVQNSPVWEDKAASRPAIEALIRDAALPPRTLVVLPEMCETGFCFKPEVTCDGNSAAWFSSLAKQFGVWLVGGAGAWDAEGQPRNAAFVCSPAGEVVARYWKAQLFDLTGEGRHYVKGSEVVVVDMDGVKVAPFICYDLRFPELFRAAARAGAEVFTVGACWPLVRRHHWDALARARAVENQGVVAACSRTGWEAAVECGGGSLVADWDGRSVAQADQAVGVVRASVDMDALRAWRRKFPALRDMRNEFFSDLPRPVLA